MVYPENIKEIKKFAREIGIDVKYLLGERFEGYLDLPSVRSLPANIVFNVDGWLDLPSVRSLPANIVFNVGGDLYLYSVKSLPDNVVFNVGGDLFLDSVRSLPSNTIFNVKRKIRFPTMHKVKVIWS